MIDYLVSISSTKVAPETSITKVVHEERVDPNFTMVAAVRPSVITIMRYLILSLSYHNRIRGMMKNSPKFRAASETCSTQLVSIDIPLSLSLLVQRSSGRRLILFAGLGYLKKYAATPEAQVHKAFYDKQITRLSGLHAVLNGKSPEDKQRLFAKSSALWDDIKVFIIETLPNSITEGPFIGGVRPGVDDFHVGAWIARIAFVSGGQKSVEGLTSLEKRFGPLPEKVKAYWTAWIGRDSWVKAYPENALH